MTTLEKSGKSVEIALSEALRELGATREQVEIEVIEEARKGFFGIGSRDAKIRVTLKETESVVEEKAEIKEVLNEQNIVNNVVNSVEEEKIEENSNSGTTAENDSVENEAKTIYEEKKDVTSLNKKEERGFRRGKGEKKNYGRESANRFAHEAEEFEVDENAVNVAKEFLNKIFAAMKIKVAMEKFVNRQTACIVFKLHGDDMGILIGKHGQTLDALQYLTNLVANKNSSSHMHIVIDVEDYRDRREETLTRLAHRLAEKVKKTGERVVLEPMNPHERKIIHTALQGDRSITTLSEGSDPYRKVVIELKR